jgi:predicted PurR-regulated permease PerM
MVVTDTFIKPKLIGSRADIHPMFVLVGVLGGAAAFGFIGLFLGPLLVGVTIAVLKVYEADYLDPEVNLLDEHVSDPGFPDEPADPDTAPPL